MKTLLTSLVLSLLSIASWASEEVAMVDVPIEEQVVQSIEFAGKPGAKAQAALIKMDDSAEISVLITHQYAQDSRHFVAVDNSKLGIYATEIAGNETVLSVNGAGSLEINQQNSALGRDRWERTITVAYRNGKYVLAGFTFSYRDTLNPASTGHCDYNLMSGRGLFNGKKVQLKTKNIDFESLEDSEKLYNCQGW